MCAHVCMYMSVYECVCLCACICECICECVRSVCVRVLSVPALLWPSGPAARPHGALTLGDGGWRCSQLSTLGLGLGCVRGKVRLRRRTRRARRESSRGRGGAGSEIGIQREVKLTAGDAQEARRPHTPARSALHLRRTGHGRQDTPEA